MNQFFAREWHRKETEKREDRRKRNEVQNINRQLHRILSVLVNKVDKSAYEDQVRFISRDVVNCSLWQIRYANNYENPKVAVAQATLIELVIKTERKKEWNHLLLTSERLVQHLHHINTNAYHEHKLLKNKVLVAK